MGACFSRVGDVHSPRLPDLGDRLIAASGIFGKVREIRHGKLVCCLYAPKKAIVKDGLPIYMPGRALARPAVILRPARKNCFVDPCGVAWKPLPKGTYSLSELFDDVSSDEESSTKSSISF